MIPLKKWTSGKDIYRTFKEFVLVSNLPVQKFFSTTMNDAPDMVGKNKAFLAMYKNDDSFPQFTDIITLFINKLCAQK